MASLHLVPKATQNEQTLRSGEMKDLDIFVESFGQNELIEYLDQIGRRGRLRSRRADRVLGVVSEYAREVFHLEFRKRPASASFF